MDEALFRLVNLAILFTIAGTLSWRHFYFRSRNGIDNRLRSGASILLFGWLAVSSGVAYDAGFPVLFTTEWLTGFLMLYLVTLWTPWRWHLPRR